MSSRQKLRCISTKTRTIYIQFRITNKNKKVRKQSKNQHKQAELKLNKKKTPPVVFINEQEAPSETKSKLDEKVNYCFIKLFQFFDRPQSHPEVCLPNETQNKNVIPPETDSEILQERIAPKEDELTTMKLKFIAKGLPNIGNTCYMNTALQIFMNIPGVCEHFLTKNYQMPFCKIMTQFIKAYRSENIKEYDLEHYLLEIKNFAATKDKDFEGFEQNDSKDIILCLLAIIKEESNQLRNSLNEITGNDDDEFERRYLEQGKTFWNSYLKYSKSLIYQKFSYMFYTKQRCLENESHLSIQFFHENYIELRIPSNMKIVTLDDCFQETVRSFVLNSYCNQCIKKMKCACSDAFLNLPDVLFLVLRRFVDGEYKTPIDIPHEIDLKKYVQDDTETTRNYKLIAFAEHLGYHSLGGHFEAYIKDVRSSENNKWFCLSDTYSKEVQIKNKGNTDVYYLIYIREESKLDEKLNYCFIKLLQFVYRPQSSPEVCLPNEIQNKNVIPPETVIEVPEERIAPKEVEPTTMKLKFIAKGLPNIGNTCYMNTALQIFMNIPGVCEHFLTKNYQMPFCKIMTQFIKAYRSENIKEYDLEQHLFKIKNFAASKDDEFEGFEQEDSTNMFLCFFVIFLVETKQSLTDIVPNLRETIGEDGGKSERRCIEQGKKLWKTCLKNQCNDYFYQKFGYMYYEKERCLENESHLTMQFSDNTWIPLSTPSNMEIVTLDDCFQETTKTRAVEIDCSHCKKKTKSTSRFLYLTLPDVIFLVICRHDKMSREEYLDKTPIDFPHEIDLKKYVQDDTETTWNYKLIAFAENIGDYRCSGHYEAYIKDVRSTENNKWYCLSDSDTEEVQIKNKGNTDVSYIVYIREKQEVTL